MNRSSARPFGSDRGATAIMVAMMMIVIMGMAAIAIDLSAGFNERRQDQTASDLAAVAGALSFNGGSTAVVNEVLSTARINLDSTYSDADWVALWTGCTDPDMPAGFVPMTHSSLGTMNCISANPSFLRVRLPDQTTDATFGRILGVDTLTTHADTEVTFLGDGGTGSLPFAVRADASSGEICLDTSTGSKIVPPCDGNESGSFGNIAPPLFGNPDLLTTPECKNQTSANNHVAESIAMGIDHFIFSMTSGSWTAGGLDPNRKQDMNKNNVDPFTNMDECNDTGGALAEAADGVPINGVFVDTGNSVKANITVGLMTGTGFSDGKHARLTRLNGTKRNVDGYNLDDVPLWDHLNATHPDGGCDGSTIQGISTVVPPATTVVESKSQALATCLKSYVSNGYTAQIFNDSIMDSPRLGTTPRIWFNVLGSGLSYAPVKGFDVVYINGLWFDDKDETVFYPGDADSWTLGKWKDVEQVTAFLLDDNMVSTKVHAQLGGVANDTFQPTISK